MRWNENKPPILDKVCLAVIALALTGAARVRGEPETAPGSLDSSRWTRLPAGFLPGEGRLLIERDGRALPFELPASLDLSNHEEARVRIGGDVTLRLAGRGAGGRGATLTILRLGEPGDRTLVRVVVEARFRHQELAQPARFVDSVQPRGAEGNDTVFFLGLAGGGHDVARGLYDPSRDEGIDCGRIDREFRFRLLPPGSAPAGRPAGGGVRVSGSVPQGRELVLFDWTLRTGVMGVIRDRPLSTPALYGWRLRGLSAGQLREGVEELAPATLIGRGGFVEIGDGWQSRRAARALFTPIERDWLSHLPADPVRRGGAPDGRDPASPDPRLRGAGDADEVAPALAAAKTAPEDEEEDDDGAKEEGGADSVESVVRLLLEKGLQAGIWVVPHGQTSDAAFESRPDAFVRDRSGRAVSGSFLGKYVVDPTSGAGEAYLRELFRRLRATGARVFRIDGLERAVLFYRVHHYELANDSGGAVEIVKRSLAIMRESAGAGAVLAGEYGTPEELAGALDAIRPEVRGGESLTDLQREGLAASNWLPLHRRLLNVESLPLSPESFANDRDDLARTLGTYVRFTALTGRGITLDGSWEVPDAVRPLLREIGRPAEVYPLDMLRRGKPAPIWVLKPSATEPDRSVVGVVNWSDLLPTTVQLAASELGVDRPERGATLVWFDLVGERCIGAGWQPRDVFLLPGHSRFICVDVLRDVPRVLAVSGHVLRRDLFLRDLHWDPGTLLLSGTVDVDDFGENVPENESVDESERAAAEEADRRDVSLRVHVAVPGGLRPVQVLAEGGRAGLSAAAGHVVVTIESEDRGADSSRAASFRLAFARATDARPENLPARFDELKARYQEAARRPLLEWRMSGGGHESWREVAGFEVLRDGEVIGRTSDTRFLDASVEWGKGHEYVVRTVARLPDATTPPAVVRQTFSFPDPVDTRLANLFPHRVEGHPPTRSRSTTGGPLLVGGRRARDGWGVRPPSRMDFRIDGCFSEFRSGIGVDDAARLQGSVVFVVLVDGREAYRSPRLEGDGRVPREIRVDTRGAERLSLILEDAGDGTDWDYADWCDPRLSVAAQ